MEKVSVIIPTLNAEKDIERLISLVNKQTVDVNEIIVVDSQSDDKTVSIAKKLPNVNVIEILRKDFDHGKTRDMALRQCRNNIVVFMTQDAIPYNEECLENLVKVLNNNSQVAVVCARQLPKEGASPMERLIRKYNYPETSNIRSKKDISVMGIKTFFCSDVCAAYNKEIYEKIGGFDYPIKTNEDMFFAAKAINNGYYVAYSSEAAVYHSHNFTLIEQYKRNYIQGYEIELHKEILNNVAQNSAGIRLVRFVSINLLSKFRIISFIQFGFDCCARFLGNKIGKHMAKKSKKKCSFIGDKDFT